MNTYFIQFAQISLLLLRFISQKECNSATHANDGAQLS